MNPISGVAIYFIMWWLVLFMVLPFGVKNAHETGEVVEEGNDPGAPSVPGMLKKVVITTVLATLLFALFYASVTRGWLSFDDIPFLGGMPKLN
jgi:predicted secreted protein